ncbi:ribulose-phosphate 3-epimerase [Ruminococcus sp.]|uniref:ribulose-phosphate 3-epimerase n=1 Tax=Ruminococcus sp. TaxID=41978 RepID=UPI001B51DF71|nr:ribulose-phosphate 3-epimerase [Ruminococcus sp.]MBP5432835.1 ribulose-phosphate 3-epimerase [Ruminococcus sp.]
MKNYVSASVLSADMLELHSEIKKLERNGIDMLHFDVMDGIFVNNITFGLPILQQVRKVSGITLDVHLMIKEPERYIKRFAEAGADIISFHVESDSDPVNTLKAIRECGVRSAVALKPATPAETVYELLPYLDMVLIMTVEPGFGGQSFIPEMAEKIKAVRSKITELGLDIDVEVDGGINSETAAVVRSAGANVLVSGSYLFNAADMSAAANALKEDRVC